jgi:translation initiation factor IF-1
MLAANHISTVLWGFVMSDRDTWPFDLRRGDVVTLDDGRSGVLLRIYCGDLWVVRLVDGDEVMARRGELTWKGDTGERPSWFTPPA